MTCSLTLAGQPHAGAHSKPIIRNKKYKKQLTFRKHAFNRENNLKISDEKKTLLA